MAYDYHKRKRDYCYKSWQESVNAVYKGSVLIWQAIRSCFGLGYWDDDKPWLDEDAWQD